MCTTCMLHVLHYTMCVPPPFPPMPCSPCSATYCFYLVLPLYFLPCWRHAAACHLPAPSVGLCTLSFTTHYACPSCLLPRDSLPCFFYQAAFLLWNRLRHGQRSYMLSLRLSTMI